MTGLHVDIPQASVTILTRDPLINRAQSQYGWRLSDRRLVIGGTSERSAFVPVGDPTKRMPTRNILIQDGGESLDIPYNRIHFEWIQRCGRWGSAEPGSVGDALRGPEELAKIIERQGHTAKVPDGPAL
jgi:hypothetical protein